MKSKESTARSKAGVRRRCSTVKRTKRVAFGTVTVQVIPATKSEVKRNIEASREVLDKFLVRIQRSGVSIPFESSVPFFHADPEDPHFLIRTFNNKVERVQYKDGDFVVCK
jgi:hypothetical protein